ncbi:54S ribosomal protein L3 [Xylariomycetidae sp. FL2044]|nr:54S ribosomal protein L3 [Xylariomycetidae sp. FL2044]
MKRIRLERVASQIVAANSARPLSISTRFPRAASASRLAAPAYVQRRCESTASAIEPVQDDSEYDNHDEAGKATLDPLPSPRSERALASAKLAALHARLSLSSKIPLQTLARTLVDPSADAHPSYNNANLAYMGATLLSYHASEYLIVRYPRLPMAILFAAMKGYTGAPPLYQVSRAWGTEPAAAPGEEVDPGLLQFDANKPTVMMNKWGYARAESKAIVNHRWRRGMSSRVLYDDAFGEMANKEPGKESQKLEVSNAKNTKDLMVEDPAKNAHANFVRAVIGAIYLHCGREAAQLFVKGHIFSRHLDLSSMFEFKVPTRELARLCAREDFEAPIARLLSETGRMSRTPVFVVGIYSGNDKLGEGSGPSLDSARALAAINALKSWYLYSPGDDVGLPSDTFAEDAPRWKPAYVDIGEIIV